MARLDDLSGLSNLNDSLISAALWCQQILLQKRLRTTGELGSSQSCIFTGSSFQPVFKNLQCTLALVHQRNLLFLKIEVYVLVEPLLMQITELSANLVSGTTACRKMVLLSAFPEKCSPFYEM